ncbi:hypothetical protein IAT38_003693 [Cryptococcus sp. DSM 104549]
MAKLDPIQVCRQAELCRPGHTATLNMPESAEALRQMAVAPFCGMNVHIQLEFEDGVQWMVRAHRAIPAPHPAELQRVVTESEAATMKFLHRQGLRVPDAWLAPCLNSEDAAFEDDYFFEEFVLGAPPCPIFLGTARALTPHTAGAFLEDLARHYIAMSDTTLDIAPGIGSLRLLPDGGIALGPLITRSPPSIQDPPYFAGPFRTQRDRYVAALERAIDAVVQQQEVIGRPVEYCLWIHEVREMVEQCELLGREETEFFVKHGDDGHRQYLVDTDGHITGALEWEWAFVTTKAEAFSGNTSLLSSSKWRNGDNSLTSEELQLVDAFTRFGRPDLADCLRNGRLYHRINDILDFRSWNPSLPGINATREALLRDKVGPSVTSMAAWRKEAMAKWGDDPRLKEAAEAGKTEMAKWTDKNDRSMLPREATEDLEQEGTGECDVGSVVV